MTEEVPVVINLNEEINKKVNSLKSSFKVVTDNSKRIKDKMGLKRPRIKEFIGKQNTVGRLVLGISSILSLYFLYKISYLSIDSIAYEVRCGFSKGPCELIYHPSPVPFISKLLIIVGITAVILFFLNYRNTTVK